MHLMLLASLTIPSANAPVQDWLDRVLDAAQLPVAANEARREGVSGIQLGEFLDMIHRRGVPAQDAREVLDEEVRAVRSGGPKENFGAFVQTQLDAGLRGRALADAIHEEHRRRGMGRPDDRGPKDRGDDRRDDADRPGQPGRGNANDNRDDKNRDRGRENRPNPRDTTKGKRP